MVAVQIEEILHEYIDSADKKKLQAIYTVLKDTVRADYVYSKDGLENIQARRTIYKKAVNQHLL